MRSLPLKFTRVLPKTTDPTNHPDGLIPMQYHVVPLALPDPIRASVSQGLGVDYEASFLLMDGGRSFAQTHTSLAGNGAFTTTWGRAPMWPLLNWTMAGAGSATATITTTGTQFATALVLDLSGLTNQVVEVDCRDRTIWVSNVETPTLYVSGDYPVIGDPTVAATTFTWTNTTNMSSPTANARESDYV